MDLKINAFLDLVFNFEIRLSDFLEIFCLKFCRKAFQALIIVKACLCLFKHLLIDIGSCDLDPAQRKVFCKKHYQRIRLVAGRARSAPYLYRRLLNEILYYLVFQDLPLLRITPELRNIDRQIVYELFKFIFILIYIILRIIT